MSEADFFPTVRVIFYSLGECVDNSQGSRKVLVIPGPAVVFTADL